MGSIPHRKNSLSSTKPGKKPDRSVGRLPVPFYKKTNTRNCSGSWLSIGEMGVRWGRTPPTHAHFAIHFYFGLSSYQYSLYSFDEDYL
jgi:hypothetical protein